MKLNIKCNMALLCAVLVILAPAMAMAMVAGGSDTVTGLVEQYDSNIYITTADGQYLVTGYDLSEMVGKAVLATGTVTESGGKTIEVTSVEEQ